MTVKAMAPTQSVRKLLNSLLSQPLHLEVHPSPRLANLSVLKPLVASMLNRLSLLLSLRNLRRSSKRSKPVSLSPSCSRPSMTRSSMLSLAPWTKLSSTLVIRSSGREMLEPFSSSSRKENSIASKCLTARLKILS